MPPLAQRNLFHDKVRLNSTSLTRLSLPSASGAVTAVTCRRDRKRPGWLPPSALHIHRVTIEGDLDHCAYTLQTLKLSTRQQQSC